MGYHTLWQVVVGSALGMLSGLIWYFIFLVKIKPQHYLKLCQSPIGRYFLLRDSFFIKDVIAQEYKMCLDQAKKEH